MQTPQIELLHVTAWSYPKGEICFHDITKHVNDNTFWMAGDTYFSTPKPFLEHIPELHQWMPKVNLIRYECEPSANNVTGLSLLDMEFIHRGASDSVAHDGLIFKAAFQRHKPAHHFEPALFTLVYSVAEFVEHTDEGNDISIEYTCRGELDFSRLNDICILPEAGV